MAAARQHAPRAPLACRSPRRLGLLWWRHAPPGTLSLTPSSPSPPLALPSNTIERVVAAVRRHCPQSHCLASPTRPEETQGRLHHLRGDTRRRTPRIGGYLAFFLLCRPRSPSLLRRLHTSPEPAQHLVVIAVSPYTIPLFSPCRLPALAVVSVGPENSPPPDFTPPWPEPVYVTPEHESVLLVSPGS